MSPDDYIATDETLYPTIGDISLKTYNKDKSAKYGLNFRSLGSSRRPYIYYTVPYTGRPVEVTESHIKDTLTLVKRIVEGYEQEGYSLKGTYISMDRHCKSIPLAKWRKKYYLHKDDKFKSKRAAKRNQRNKKLRRKQLDFLQKQQR